MCSPTCTGDGITVSLGLAQEEARREATQRAFMPAQKPVTAVAARDRGPQMAYARVMAALRCTAKLLKRLGVTRPEEPPPPENALGDWYANILFTRSGHFVLLVSERTRLPVLLSARDLPSFPHRLLHTLSELLADIGVPSPQIDREIEAMQPLYFGKTANRSVLGTLNDNASLVKYHLAVNDLSIHSVMLLLARAPCLPLEGLFPDRATRNLLANPHGLRAVE